MQSKLYKPIVIKCMGTFSLNHLFLYKFKKKVAACRLLISLFIYALY